MKNILLISMPFASTKWPAIGISLLKPQLAAEGIPCDIRYFNILFAQMIGLDTYEDVAIYPRYIFGERLFAKEYFGSALPPEEEYQRYLQKVYKGPVDSSFDRLFAVSGQIGPFIERCLAEVAWDAYDIIGFTSMFEQNLSSLLLARSIKQRYPEKTIIMGGANCEREMGVELHHRFPEIDYVCSGEADKTFPELVKRLAKGEPVDTIPGVVTRLGGKSAMAYSAEVVEDLDRVSVPDYSDYFQQLEHSTLPPEACYEIHMESSRGCWWGAKSQCKFCGLNGKAIHYRCKSKDRIVKELLHLVDTYALPHNLKLISMVDNVLSMDSFKELLPELKRLQLPVKLFYEVKANLNEEQVRMLAEANIAWIQPGIESLSTRVLKLMEKGVTALQNVQLLKHSKQFGVYPTWNIIYRSPGEQPEDYRQMIDLIYKITHLAPPEGFIPLCMQRFSPYFNNPKEFGIASITPEESYRFIYPFGQESIAKLAYFFDFEFEDRVAPPPGWDKELEQAVEYWRQCAERGENLESRAVSAGDLVIRDSRSTARQALMHLEGAHKSIYEFCGSGQDFSSIYGFTRETFSREPVRERDVRDFLDEMVALDYMISENSRYLSLAIPAA